MQSKNTLWILIVFIVLYLGSVAYFINDATNRTGGKFTYIYDDAYIHMGIAKNFVEYGTWGATPHEFTSTTSSPLWTVILSSVFAVTGVNEWVPLLVNLMAGVGLLTAVYFILRREQVTAWSVAVALGGIWLLMPLPFLTLAGMEHVLHALLTVIYLYVAGKLLVKGEFSLFERESSLLMGITPLVVMARYEALFMVFLVCLLFLLRRNFRYAVILGGLVWTPVIIYGLVNVAHDWFFLPGSVVIKSSAEAPGTSFASLGEILSFIKYYALHGLLTIARDSVFSTLMVLGAAFFYVDMRREDKGWKLPSAMLLVFLGMGFLHFELAAPFMRYYPYLVAAGIIGVVLAWDAYSKQFGITWEITWDKSTLPRILATVLLVIFAVLPLGERGWDLLERIPGAMTNLHDQQYQMAMFLHKYYDGERVAMNDIGTTTLFTQVHLLDLVGLGTLDVAKIVVNDEPFDAARIQQVAQDYGAQIAVIYDLWYDVPPEWIAVGYWSTPSAGFLGSDVVTFYAIDPAAEEHLIASLQAYQDRLPERVTQYGKYTE